MARLIITGIKNGIYVFDTETNEVIHKHSPARAMGIQKVNRGYYCADRHDGLYRLDSKLNIINMCEGFNGAYNLHDVRIIGEKAYIVDSANNGILIYSIPNGRIIDEIYLFGNINGNIHNLNALQCQDGKLYLSMFLFDGTKASLDYTIPNKIRFADPTGAIIKLDPENKIIEEVICDNLWQPHSIHFIDGEIHFLESMTGKLFKNNEAVLTIPNAYVRGLVSDENYIYLCKNTFRGNQDRVPVSVIILDKQYNIIREVEVPFSGLNEVYDLILM